MQKKSWKITLPELTEYRRNKPPVTWRMPPSLNARMHWSARCRVCRWFHDQTVLLLMEAKVPKGIEKIYVEVVNFTAHPCDRDNLASSMKPVQDALTARQRGQARGYGVIADDTPEHLEVAYSNCHLAKGGKARVEMTISAV